MGGSLLLSIIFPAWLIPHSITGAYRQWDDLSRLGMCGDRRGVFSGITLWSSQRWLLCGNMSASSSSCCCCCSTCSHPPAFTNNLLTDTGKDWDGDLPSSFLTLSSFLISDVHPHILTMVVLQPFKDVQVVFLWEATNSLRLICWETDAIVVLLQSGLSLTFLFIYFCFVIVPKIADLLLWADYLWLD